ncbi:PREDICTED: cytochrome c oxidase subunit 7A1, mitochondrial-like isoform X1 [Trachymyrmex cornetzi]|uniref:cytochrome c oxidase subunit 7A1, mitochondrial-like isoform X1 n=1 Tax=Trachymyrmex cornetzi TaxID=471704 RepID=UPI00084EEC20|nr:PREDICTED: cytochrome c oxidase subunit 7A1, mitochondrial-like isoform X1 [Trachymyrmex cornetzi]
MLHGVAIKPGRISKMFKWNMHKIRVYNALLPRKLFGTNQSLVECKEFQKFKLKQAKMQCDDGLPVYLKGGIRDKIVFYILSSVVFVNTILSVYTLIQSEYCDHMPKKS